MSEWKAYRKAVVTEARPYVPGESMRGITINQVDSLEEGGMVCRNPNAHGDQWYVSKSYFAQSYVPAEDQSDDGK